MEDESERTKNELKSIFEFGGLKKKTEEVRHIESWDWRGQENKITDESITAARGFVWNISKETTQSKLFYTLFFSTKHFLSLGDKLKANISDKASRSRSVRGLGCVGRQIKLTSGGDCSGKLQSRNTYVYVWVVWIKAVTMKNEIKLVSKLKLFIQSELQLKMRRDKNGGIITSHIKQSIIIQEGEKLPKSLQT